MNPFSLIKFFSGFNLLNPEKLGKLLFYSVIIVGALVIYHKLFEPKTVTVNKAPVQYITNVECKDKNIVGLKLGPIKLGVGL